MLQHNIIIKVYYYNISAVKRLFKRRKKLIESDYRLISSWTTPVWTLHKCRTVIKIHIIIMLALYFIRLSTSDRDFRACSQVLISEVRTGSFTVIFVVPKYLYPIYSHFVHCFSVGLIWARLVSCRRRRVFAVTPEIMNGGDTATTTIMIITRCTKPLGFW